MPTVAADKELLFSYLERHYGHDEFEKLLFDFGLEFDGEEAGENGEAAYRIEVPANRSDLLSVEGIGRALRVFLGLDKAPPQYRLVPSQPNPKLTLHVKASVARIRPFGFAAVLRGVTFTEKTYASFIDLQDKLHHNIARRRQLVAIGTHDLATIEGPFCYSADDPKDIKFVPLNQTEVVDGYGCMRLLETHKQLSAYLPIIRNSPVYPVIRDSNGVVLSLPPVINGNHSKISLNTRDVFIDVTATDRTKGLVVINCLCALFSEHCKEKFSIEPVRVEYEKDHPILGGESFVYPAIEDTEFRTSVDYIRSVCGVPSFSSSDVVDLLRKMMIKAEVQDGGTIIAKVPPTRADVIHPCDLAEDVAIAYGYNNVVPTQYRLATVQSYMSVSEQIRKEIANCGFHECLNWGLCSLKESFANFKREPLDKAPLDSEKSVRYNIAGPPVRLSNPKTKEFEIVRVSLIPGLLKSLAANKAKPLPLRLFEIGDCARIEPNTETQTLTFRHCAALYASNAGGGLEEVHGLLDALLMKLQLTPEYVDFVEAGGRRVKRTDKVYTLQPIRDPMFLEGRAVAVVVSTAQDKVEIGVMGMLHPEVLAAFNLSLPCSVFEFTVEPFLRWLPETDLLDE